MAEGSSGTNRAPLLPRALRREPVLWGAAIGLLLVLLYADVGAVFIGRWFSKSTFYHCIAVPPLVAWLVWIRRERLREVGIRPCAWGVVLLGFGLGIAVIGARLGVNLITGISFPIVAAGLVLLLMGAAPLRILTMPLMVSFFGIAPPEHVLGIITMPAQKISALFAQHVSRAVLGLPVTRDGIILDLSGHKFTVAEQCSGMSSFLAMVLTVVVLIELAGLPTGRTVIALLSIPAIVIIANVMRLCLVLLTAHYMGTAFATGHLVHGGTDAIVYVAALIMVIIFLSALSPRSPVEEVDEAPGSAEEEAQ